MIPKTIHYCWFGRNPKPKLAKKCIRSWKKFCPDYEIVEWNEDNFDIASAPLYVRQAYEAKKWAFVTDYVRLQVVYENGGIYLDTDVELLKNWDHLLDNQAFFGFEDNRHIATGLGFGAEKNNAILLDIMKDYQEIPFIKNDGTLDLLPCPQRNLHVFSEYGFQTNNTTQLLNNCLIMSSEYLCPVGCESGRKNITKNTISIHWFGASWISEENIKKRNALKKQIQKKDKIHNMLHIPNRIGMWILGKERYEKLKQFIKKG